MMKKLASTICSALLLASFNVSAMEAHQPSTVVELYTSQGCSSCPPADALMGRLVEHGGKEVLGLSFAVTYWDYIGWKDTFGRSENDIRQARYRDQMGARYVYTPQMVVAGENHFVGSDGAKLKEQLSRFDGHAKKLDLKWRIEGKKIHITLPQSDTPATLWQVDIDHLKEVNIQRGENSGRQITYHNVVRNSERLQSWDGNPTEIVLDMAELEHQGRDGCALLVQKGESGPIIAALQIDL